MRVKNWLLTGTSLTILALAPMSATWAQDANDPTLVAAYAAFQADPQSAPVRILLATDAASEGIDLQNHCAHLIHYEIPWNPNRLEQRNGRIDRTLLDAPLRQQLVQLQDELARQGKRKRGRGGSDAGS